MSGYLLCIVGTVLLSAVLTAILPNGKTAGVIKAIAKLACLISIIAPIPKFLQADNFFDILNGKNPENPSTNLSSVVIQTDGEFIKYYSEIRIQNTQDALEKELLEKFDTQTQITFVWEFENEAIDTDKIHIMQIKIDIQTDIDEKEKEEMWAYVKKNYCSEVLIE